MADNTQPERQRRYCTKLRASRDRVPELEAEILILKGALHATRCDGTLRSATKPHAANEKGGKMSLDEPKIEKALAAFNAARQRLFVALNEEWLDDSEDCDDVAASSDVNLLANAFMRAASAAEDLVYSILHPSNREGAAQHADVTLDQASQLIGAVDFRGDQREAA
jgi:hypothetical protein